MNVRKFVPMLLILSVSLLETGCGGIRVKVATDCIVFTEDAPVLTPTQIEDILHSNLDDVALEVLNQQDNFIATYNELHTKFC